MRIGGTAAAVVGETPLVALSRMSEGLGGENCVKLESMNPGGSIKDRAARAIIEAARADGRLAPRMPVVEMTSGNMGAGLAVVCATLGHPLVVTMSAGNSPARARMLEGLGAKVILVEQVEGSPGQVTGADVEAAAEAARDYAARQGAFYVDQFNAVEGITAHERTGAEILDQAGGPVDAWVAAVGSGCTFMGVAKALKAAAPYTVCAVVEPTGCRPLVGEPVVKPKHLIQGTSYGLVPPHWDPSLMDVSFDVTDDEALVWRSRLAHEEGVYVGYSAAANVCGAVKLLGSGKLKTDATVVTVLCDTGLKY